MTELSPGQVSARLDGLDGGLACLGTDVEELVAALDGGRPAPRGPDGELSTEPAFATVIDWMHRFLLPSFVRSAGGQVRWCQR